MAKKTAVVYCRVSLDRQKSEGKSLESQLEECEKYAQQNGFKVVGRYKDDYTATRITRPEFDIVREMIANRKMDAVITNTSDRWTRKLIHRLELRELMKQNNIELHYPAWGKIDLNSPGGIQGSFDEYWRDKIAEATKRTLRYKASHGQWPCAGSPGYGFDHVGKGKEAQLVINEAEAQIAMRIFRECVDGRQTGAIVAALNDDNVPTKRNNKRGWSRSTVTELLRDKNYIGEFTYGRKTDRQGQVIDPGVTVHLPHLAIVDRATFDAAQARLDQNIKRGHQTHFYLLGGRRLECVCGRHLCGGRAGKKNEPHYRCWNRNQYRKGEHECDFPMIKADLVDSTVYNWLIALTSSQEYLDNAIDDMIAEAKTKAKPLQKRLQAINAGIARLSGETDNLVRNMAKVSDWSDEFVAHVKHQTEAMNQQKQGMEEEREKVTRDLDQYEWLLSGGVSSKLVIGAIIDLLGDKQKLVNRLDVRVKILSRQKIKVSCKLFPRGKVLTLGEVVEIPDEVIVTWSADKRSKKKAARP